MRPRSSVSSSVLLPQPLRQQVEERCQDAGVRRLVDWGGDHDRIGGHHQRLRVHNGRIAEVGVQQRLSGHVAHLQCAAAVTVQRQPGADILQQAA
jgi:hypothetical protein